MIPADPNAEESRLAQQVAALAASLGMEFTGDGRLLGCSLDFDLSHTRVLIAGILEQIRNVERARRRK